MGIFFVLILAFFTVNHAWPESDILDHLKLTLNVTDFRDFLLIPTTLDGKEYLIFFGGYAYDSQTGQTFLNNKLYQLDLNTKQTQQLGQTLLVKPQIYYQICGIIVREKLFLYGGYGKNDTSPNQMWQFDFLTQQWTLRGTSQNLQGCMLQPLSNDYPNDTIGIVGLQRVSRQFQIIEYYLFNYTFQKASIIFYNAVNIETTLWDDTNVTSFLRIDSHKDLEAGKVVGNSQVEFPVKTFCTLNYDKNSFFMITNNGMYVLAKGNSTFTISFYDEYYQHEMQTFKCESIDQWVFFVFDRQATSNSLQRQIVISYMHIPTWTNGKIHQNLPNLYVQWLDPLYYFTTFHFNNSLYLVNEKLQTFYLSAQCEGTPPQSNYYKCQYGMYSCQQGYTSKFCNISTCPGSLRILNKNDFPLIQSQCSGNGKCTKNGCKCEDFWGGKDCSIYQRQQCLGTLIQNFLVANCQCNSPTVGGNACEVVFCYNDCGGQGVCQSSGQCLCNQGYTGPDCTILEITFDLI